MSHISYITKIFTKERATHRKKLQKELEWKRHKIKKRKKEKKKKEVKVIYCCGYGL